MMTQGVRRCWQPGGIFFQVFLLLVVGGLTSLTAQAQGILIPQEPNRPRPPVPRPVPIPRTLKIKSIRITTTIKNQVARTHIEQIFLNETPYTLEGTYCFPIPESAALSEFAIWEGNRRLVGEVVERAKARQIYDSIVRTMRDPGLLEYSGKDLFQASVFPIPGNSEKKIELAYSQVLTGENGIVRYRYPLGSGQRAQGEPPQSVVGQVEIDSPTAIKTIYSPSHSIDTKRDGEKKARLSFEVSGQKGLDDFQLYYGLSEKDFGVSLVTHREPGKDGYFLLLIAPKVAISERDRLAKDIVFIFDTSGSMSGEKIEKAKNALKFGLQSLSPVDRFNVIRFSGEEHLFENGLVEASPDTIKRAVQYVDDFRAEGGTNINDSLLAGLKLFSESAARPRMVVFVTDGLPTVGTTDAATIIKNVTAANQTQARIFTFGVGYDVNTQLLDKIAEQNRAVSDYIEPNEDLEVKVSNFFGRINYPVLSDVKLDFGGVQVDYVYPKALTDLFRGGQFMLVGRYRNNDDQRATIRLSGMVQNKEQSFAYEGNLFGRTVPENDFLPKLWATRRVGVLMDQIRLNGQNKELVDEIVALGTRHGIVTPYTSYLATETNQPPPPAPMIGGGRQNAATKPGYQAPRKDPFADEAIVRQSNSEAGAGKKKAGQEPRDPFANAPKSQAVSGAEAVRESKDTAKLRDADKAENIQSATVRTIKNKRFYLVDAVWIDADVTADDKIPTVDLKFGSDEYFALLKQKPELADYFALGTRVTVFFEGKIYRVTD